MVSPPGKEKIENRGRRRQIYAAGHQKKTPDADMFKFKDRDTYISTHSLQAQIVKLYVGKEQNNPPADRDQCLAYCPRSGQRLVDYSVI